MNYAEPEYSVELVNQAGKLLANPALSQMTARTAIEIIDNWRAAHAYPLQVFYVTMKRRAEGVNQLALPSQRTKRLESIVNKLRDKSDMKLSQMQDIGGCRVVLPKIKHVRQLEEIYRRGGLQHEALKPRDYIVDPKANGYRSLHLRYRYKGEGEKAAFNGLKIEIQIRTALQHIWATAVEAADIFTNQELKASRGRNEWHRFFALMSSVFALEENSPLVAGTPTTYIELAKEIAELDAAYRIASVFAAYTTILPHVEKKEDVAYYFLVKLDPEAKTASVFGFRKDQSKVANHRYTEAEAAIQEGSLSKVVLVSVSSIRALRKAYPNYFLDTSDFLAKVRKIIRDGRLSNRKHRLVAKRKQGTG